MPTTIPSLVKINIKIFSRKKEPWTEDEGWCTDELRRARMSSSNLLPCLKSQDSYSIGGRSPHIFAMMSEYNQSRRKAEHLDSGLGAQSSRYGKTRRLGEWWQWWGGRRCGRGREHEREPSPILNI
jgi:hypothetical protein